MHRRNDSRALMKRFFCSFPLNGIPIVCSKIFASAGKRVRGGEKNHSRVSALHCNVKGKKFSFNFIVFVYLSLVWIRVWIALGSGWDWDWDGQETKIDYDPPPGLDAFFLFWSACKRMRSDTHRAMIHLTARAERVRLQLCNSRRNEVGWFKTAAAILYVHMNS